MITLCMDTSQAFLVIALLKDGELLDGIQEVCWKHQSEELYPRLIALLEKHGLSSDDIGEMIITKGPGSYTGVRIAMTAAKVFCSLKEIPLSVLGSLQLIAGTSSRARVLMDARGHRAYHALYENGKLIGDIEALDVDEIQTIVKEGETVLGDGHLIGIADVWPDLTRNFADLAGMALPVEQIHLLTPEYLKPSEAYLVKAK